LANNIKPWIGKRAYTKAAQDVANKHGLVAGDLQLQHAAESQMQLSLPAYRKVWSDTVRGTGGTYKSIDDMYLERQCKINQNQLSLKNYKAKDADALHKYTTIYDTPEMKRVKESLLCSSRFFSGFRRKTTRESNELELNCKFIKKCLLFG
jgi:hypothetical protein